MVTCRCFLPSWMVVTGGAQLGAWGVVQQFA
jgi:hypothetical protein